MSICKKYLGLWIVLWAVLFTLPAMSAETIYDDVWSPDKVQQFREEFIKNFERTGLNTTPGDARFLRIMVASTNAQLGVEVGSATGFGAINMGMAFEHTGGKLITIDIDPDMVKACRENIKKVGLERTVKVIEGDALEVLPKLQEKVDFVFLDALKQDYFKYFKLVQPILKPGGVIVADNVIRFKEAMSDFLNAMEEDPNYDMQIIQCSEEKGDGMAVIYRIK